jgi:hypothetical protein
MSTTKIYLMTLNSPSRRSLRLWTGKSIHALRHCSVKQIGSALVEMQRNVDDLQADIGKLAQVTEQWVAAPVDGNLPTKGRVLLKKVVRARNGGLFQPNPAGHQKARSRGSAFFRNIRQKGDSRGRRSSKG